MGKSRYTLPSGSWNLAPIRLFCLANSRRDQKSVVVQKTIKNSKRLDDVFRSSPFEDDNKRAKKIETLLHTHTRTNSLTHTKTCDFNGSGQIDTRVSQLVGCLFWGTGLQSLTMFYVLFVFFLLLLFLFSSSTAEWLFVWLVSVFFFFFSSVLFFNETFVCFVWMFSLRKRLCAEKKKKRRL